MDILFPTLERQSAPAPHRVTRQNINLRSLVDNIRRDHAAATPDEVVALLARAGIPAPGSWVAHWLSQPAAATESAWPRIAATATLPQNGAAAKPNRLRSWASRAAHAEPRSSQDIENGSVSHRDPAVTDAAHLLGRLTARAYCSFARYLQDARPWRDAGDARLWDLMTQIAKQHEAFVERASEMILSRRWTMPMFQYPARFTGYNDVSLRYVADELVREQHALIQEMEGAADALSHDDEALRLVLEAVAEQRRLSNTLEAALASALDFTLDDGVVSETIAPAHQLTTGASEHESRSPQTAA